MRKVIHDLLYQRFPSLWFAMKYRIENEYQNYVYSNDELVSYGATHRKFMAMAPVFKEVVKSKTFLELGCDTGFFTMQAAIAGADKSLGVDRNTKALSKANKVLSRLKLANVEFRRATIPDIGITGSFDTVLLISTIHYMFSDKVGNSILFESMESLISYLGSLCNSFLLVEFVAPEDPYAKVVVADKFLSSEEYSEAVFVRALRKSFTRILDLGVTHYRTRKMYLACKSGAMPSFGDL